MKIGIIGDVHFGAGFNLGRTDPETQLNTRLIDFINTFNKAIDVFVKNKVDTIIITGDIFDTRHPTSAQINSFSKCIKRATDFGFKIFIIAGNHDQQRVISTTTIDVYNVLGIPDIDIRTEVSKYDIDDQTRFIFIPYLDRRMLGSRSNDEAVEKIKEKMSGFLDGPKTKILFGHSMVDRAVSGEGAESFSINELILPLELFDGADAVVMGHVHRHQVISKIEPLVMYIGSLDKISFGERLHTKVTAILDTDKIHKPLIIESKVRNLFEINLDYCIDKKIHKNKITKKIIGDIDTFHTQYNIQDAIVKFVAKVKENDLFYVNQKKIKEHILSKNVKYLTSVQVSSANVRNLRNKNITETISGKKAVESFINNLTESEQIKKKLLRYANKIIEEVEGK